MTLLTSGTVTILKQQLAERNRQVTLLKIERAKELELAIKNDRIYFQTVNGLEQADACSLAECEKRASAVQAEEMRQIAVKKALKEAEDQLTAQYNALNLMKGELAASLNEMAELNERAAQWAHTNQDELQEAAKFQSAATENLKAAQVSVLVEKKHNKDIQAAFAHELDTKSDEVATLTKQLATASQQISQKTGHGRAGPPYMANKPASLLSLHRFRTWIFNLCEGESVARALAQLARI
ncbi:hypothetical protein K470DRAFT_266874 [Piedraia hortae CBS 480.64]|uniref:Uncharacterized protein n=1 Tax=Piedraia hortae CBS 480.64 TaxID=1314780 RepID=A0A6A7BRL3_9PEZI|nr:hypothetical protein K470DRAFT_266874 [Piedraia hortae CBS 480.64]